MTARPPSQKLRDNRIVEENSKPGTDQWQLGFTRFDDPIALASFPFNRQLRCSGMEGFCSKTSVAVGESIDVMVSMAPAGRFTLDIYRMGYYGGSGGRHMARLGPLPATPQPMPLMTVERLRECAWEKSVSIPIPEEWPSGVYLGKLARDEPCGEQSYVVFIVKERRVSDLLFQCADLTWQAYNKWPGSDSVYDDGTPELWYQGTNVRVSFDRPYAKYFQCMDAPGTIGSGSFLLWEFPMVYWLEQQGYDVTYCSNTDLHTEPEVLSRTKAFISIGHDEYWSREMFEAASKARDEGVSMAFFSGNTLWHKVLAYNSSLTGEPFRAFARAPVAPKPCPYGHLLTGAHAGPVGYGDWVITKPEHWVYDGMGVVAGDRIPSLIGWEFNYGPSPHIPRLEVVAASPLLPPDDAEGRTNYHHGVVYQAERGNWVFNAGTIWWAEGLSCPPGHIAARVPNRGATYGVHPWVQQITTNVLNRMIADAPGGV